MSDTELYGLEGPVLLLAPPGTGKTYSLAQRIKFLVEECSIDPNSITVITFTRAAAENMRKRISDEGDPNVFVPANLHPPTICTMHSLGNRIVRDKASELGLQVPIPVVRFESTRRMLMKDAAQLGGYKRNDASGTFECRQFGDCSPKSASKCEICEQYENILRGCGAIDHDDQILLACDLLAEDSELLAKYRTGAQELLVDEYQDINAGQFKLIKLLTEGKLDGLFVVGDDDQSIYSWRGGSPQFIRDFEEHFGEEAVAETLPRSYRCHPYILEGAMAIVREYDKKRRDKGELEYKIPEGSKIIVHNVPSHKREAVIIREIVQEALPSKEALILIPNRGYAPPIIEELRRARIEYVSPETLPGTGVPLLGRLAAWLNDKHDSLALRDCLEAMMNGSFLGVPSKRVRKPKRKKEREDAYSVVSSLWKPVIGDGSSLWDSLQSNRDDNKLLNCIHESLAALRSVDPAEVPDFLGRIAYYLEPWKKTGDFTEEVEAWVKRFEAGSMSGSTDIVKIMTFEGAKGLQADVVCVVGLEQGTMPREGSDDRTIAEYSRLMYVSMTRAKTDLHLFYARTRPGSVSFQQIHAPGGSHKLEPSPFLGAIPEKCVEWKYHAPK